MRGNTNYPVPTHQHMMVMTGNTVSVSTNGSCPSYLWTSALSKPDVSQRDFVQAGGGLPQSSQAQAHSTLGVVEGFKGASTDAMASSADHLKVPLAAEAF